MKELFNKVFFKYNGDQEPTIEDVRRQLLSVVLFVTVLAFPMLLLGIIEAIELKLTFAAFSFALFYLPILAAFLLKKKLPYNIIVFLLLFSGFSIAVVNVIVYGFSGAGIPVFCLIAVLATLFLGIKAGFITIFTCSIPMIIVAYLMTENLLTPGVDLMEISTLPISWATAIIVMLFLGSIMIYGFGIIQRNLINSLNFSKARSFDLQKSNYEFEAINEELRQTNEQLIVSIEKAEESSRLKTAFLSNISHEIRTPMNGILGFTSLLVQPDLSREISAEYVGIINKSGQRLLNTINDIIDISKIDTGQTPLFIEEVNVMEELLSVYNSSRFPCTEKGLKLVLNETDSARITIETDKTKLNSILTRLMNNAVKYTEKGTIEINCNRSDRELVFSVKDSGIGIPADRQVAIFNRFVQADIEDKNAFQGSGLGLSIAKAYVEMLHGKIWLDSEPGKGSAFYFTLPFDEEKLPTLTENNEQPESEFIQSVAPSFKLKILIAEDDEISSMYLAAILKKINCSVLYAFNGIETVKLCRANPDLDIVLLDFKMPQMDGYEALQKIRGFNKTVFIVAQTAFASAGDHERALLAGCNEYVSKPVKAEKLLGIIDKYAKEKTGIIE